MTLSDRNATPYAM